MPLRIEVAARIEQGSSLCIEVKNTGSWVASVADGAAAGTDTGLRNVCASGWRALHGRHAFDVYEEDGWVHARIRIDDVR